MKKSLSILALATIVFVSCHKDDPSPTPTPEVHLTQQYASYVHPNGDTISTVTQNYVWENGLLRNIHTFFTLYSTGSTSQSEETFIYDNDGNCIEELFTSSTLNYHRYFSYEGGRMTRAVEMQGADTNERGTITGYTADGHIQAITVERLSTGSVKEYQITWENGDMIAYTERPVNPAGEEVSYTIEYDNYPNVHTGMPLADVVFDPQMIASRASVHNWKILDQEYFYNNGRLVKTTSYTDAFNSTCYYTYSDGTTGRE